MAVEFRHNISKEITERGIYYATITVSFQGIKVEKKIVFSRYMYEPDLKKFFKEHTLASFGVNEKNNTKQVIHINVEPVVYLSDVNKETYNSWMISAENTTNNSII